MLVPSESLRKVTAAIFTRAGCAESEATTIARHLVESNLVGHDSHGVIRVPYYIDWLRAGKVRANQSISVVFENPVVAVVDGNFGFGQVIGEQATALGIKKCKGNAVAVIGLRNSGHLGRIGDWAIQAADAGLVSMHFINTSGGGILVAPFGGTDRRLSANPIAAGIPVAGARPMIIDMSTCVIAEGKIKVALNKGQALAAGAIIDGHGQPTTDPAAFYAQPLGAILTIAGHKGYVLSVLCEALAGSMTGSGSSHPSNPTADRVVNGMFSIFLDPKTIAGAAFGGDIERLIGWVKASPPTTPGGTILMPGEIEDATRAQRLKQGIEMDQATWSQLIGVAESVGLSRRDIETIAA